MFYFPKGISDEPGLIDAEMARELYQENDDITVINFCGSAVNFFYEVSKKKNDKIVKNRVSRKNFYPLFYDLCDDKTPLMLGGFSRIGVSFLVKSCITVGEEKRKKELEMKNDRELLDSFKSFFKRGN